MNIFREYIFISRILKKMKYFICKKKDTQQSNVCINNQFPNQSIAITYNQTQEKIKKSKKS